MRRLLLPLCVLLLVSGCVRNIGARAEQMAVVNSPNGTIAEIRVREGGEVITGELLEVRDDALVVLNAGRVTVVPFGATQSATFHDSAVYASGGAISADEISELRLFSRFPRGISPGVMTTLLAAHGQTEPRLIAP